MRRCFATTNQLYVEFTTSDRKILEEAREQMTELRVLRQENIRIQEENNLLKVKVEVLLDMVAQKTAEFELQEGDLMKLRNILANS